MIQLSYIAKNLLLENITESDVERLFKENPKLSNEVHTVLNLKEDGTVRLYRIENENIPYDTSREGTVSKREVIGGWFTDNVNTLAHYIRKNQDVDGIRLVTVDIPKSELDQYHVSKNVHTKDMDVESDNWIIPSKIKRTYTDLSTLSKVTGNFMTLSKAKQELTTIVKGIPHPESSLSDQAIKIYTQYLQNNTNGDIEGFKKFVENL